MQTVAKIGNVSSRTTQRGDIFLINADGQEYSTFKAELAREAQALIGQTVTLEYVEKPARDPKYPPNRYLDGITAAEMPLAPVEKVGADIASKDTTIWRQTAAKVAAHLLSYFPADEQTIGNFDVLTAGLVSYFQTGAPLAKVPSQPVLGQATLEDVLLEKDIPF